MKYLVNCIPLRIRVRSRNTQPHLKLQPRLSHPSTFTIHWPGAVLRQEI